MLFYLLYSPAVIGKLHNLDHPVSRLAVLAPVVALR
jgi:hypothetical protein